MPKEPANDDQKQKPQDEQQSDLERAQKDAAEKREDEGGYQ